MHAGPWKPNRPQPKKHKKITAEELAVILLFMFCWIAFIWGFTHVG